MFGIRELDAVFHVFGGYDVRLVEVSTAIPPYVISDELGLCFKKCVLFET